MIVQYTHYVQFALVLDWSKGCIRKELCLLLLLFPNTDSDHGHKNDYVLYELDVQLRAPIHRDDANDVYDYARNVNTADADPEEYFLLSAECRRVRELGRSQLDSPEGRVS